MNTPAGPEALVLLWLPIIGGLVALGLLWGAMRAARKQRLIDGLPTCKTTGVFIGLVEVKGTAESSGPLTSHLAGAPCVHYAWSVEEHWTRTVVVTTTDSPFFGVSPSEKPEEMETFSTSWSRKPRP